MSVFEETKTQVMEEVRRAAEEMIKKAEENVGAIAMAELGRRIESGIQSVNDTEKLLQEQESALQALYDEKQSLEAALFPKADVIDESPEVPAVDTASEVEGQTEEVAEPEVETAGEPVA